MGQGKRMPVSRGYQINVEGQMHCSMCNETFNDFWDELGLTK